MSDLDFVHRKVTRIPGSEHSAYGVRRCSDQAVRLRQRGSQRCELSPPLTSLPALCSPDRRDVETVKQPLRGLGFRRAQTPNYLLDING